MNYATRVVDFAGSEKYRIRDRAEIVSLLRALIAARRFVTVEWGGGDAFIVTAVLGVDAEAGEFVVDCGADDAANRALLDAPKLAFSTQLDRILIEFDAGPAVPAVCDDRPAFRFGLPDSVLRLQRRDWYRCAVPSRPAVVVRIPLPPAPGAPRRTVDVRVRDLSCGGLALVDWPDELAIAPGVALGECEIELPDVGRIVAHLEVVRVEGDAPPQNPSRRRCGCRFGRLPQRNITLIQRFIHRVERGRRRCE